jgi:hypothetical protein
VQTKHNFDKHLSIKRLCGIIGLELSEIFRSFKVRGITMKVKFQFIVAAFFLTFFFVSTAVAIEGGETRRGKGLMKSECKVCHNEGGQGGKLTPLSKTMSQWDRFFRRDKHKDYLKGFEGLSEQDLLDINQYLFDHAADSDQPQTCDPVNCLFIIL